MDISVELNKMKKSAYVPRKIGKEVRLFLKNTPIIRSIDKVMIDTNIKVSTMDKKLISLPLSSLHDFKKMSSDFNGSMLTNW